MSDALRRIYNRVERAFDMHALREERRERYVTAENGSYKTAAQALAVVLPLVRKVERDCRLKMIVGPHGTDTAGLARRWEFFFELPGARAKVEANWFLEWDDASDDFRTEAVEMVARPFPPPGSLLRDMAAEGKLLEAQLRGMWEQERRRTPDLPFRLRDSDVAVRELANQGLAPHNSEFSLGTEAGVGGRLVWVAKTRRERYETPLLASG